MENKTSISPKDRRYNAPLERAFYNVRSPFETLLKHKAASGVMLLLATILALVAMNSSLSIYYQNLINTEISLKIGGWELEETLQLWVNDGLMGIFFLIVGLEIKRELIVGELSSPRKAALPIIAAAGGMLVPAIIYISINRSPATIHGWGIPVATDIAFAIGILSLLGNHIPRSLYVFLVTLAIVDDLGAVMVIAIFYTDHLSMTYLFNAACIFSALLLLNLIGIRNTLPYYIIGAFLWFAMLKSGIHATIAGVLVAFTIPAHSKTNPRFFRERVCGLIGFCDVKQSNLAENIPTDEEQRSIVGTIKNGVRLMESPLNKVLDNMRQPVIFLVMPIFAFANAGIPLELGLLKKEIAHPVTLGVVLGLIFGKFIGIAGSSLVAIRLEIASLPGGMDRRHLFGGAMLAGMGFTMSMFIGGLAFRESAELLRLAKMGILLGSLVAGLAGYILLLSLTRKNHF